MNTLLKIKHVGNPTPSMHKYTTITKEKGHILTTNTNSEACQVAKSMALEKINLCEHHDYNCRPMPPDYIYRSGTDTLPAIVIGMVIGADPFHSKRAILHRNGNKNLPFREAATVAACGRRVATAGGGRTGEKGMRLGISGV